MGGAPRDDRRGGRRDGRSFNEARTLRSDDPNDGLRRSISRASSQADHAQVLQLFGKWRRRSAPVDEPVYRTALVACAQEGSWELAAQTLNEMEEYGLTLQANHFDPALRACDRKTRWQEALGLLDRMRSYGLRPTSRSFECAMRTCAKAGQHAMVEMLWELMREEQRKSPPLEVGMFTYNVLMRALAEGGGKGAKGSGGAAKREASAKQVIKAFDEALAAGVIVDESGYKHVLRACDLSGEWRRALNILKMMKDGGVPTDTLVYGNVMNACARDSRAQTVLQLLAQMRAEGLQPNAFCYNAAIGAASRAKRWRQAIELMEEMDEEAVRLADPTLAPTKHTYTAVLRACAASAQPRAAQRILSGMLRKGAEPSAFDFGCVIDACGRAGDVARVMKLFTQMQERGLQPDVKTFTTALMACARENQLNRALSLIERMYKMEVPPDVATYNVLLQACERQNKLEIIQQLIQQMPQLGVEPNLVNYNTGVRALCRGGDVKKVRSMFATMRERDVMPVFSTYRAAINGSCEGGHIDLAVAYLDELKAEGYSPDEHVQYALLSTCGDEERPFLERSLEVTTEEALERERQRQARYERYAYDARGGGRGGRGRGRGRGRGGSAGMAEGRGGRAGGAEWEREWEAERSGNAQAQGPEAATIVMPTDGMDLGVLGIGSVASGADHAMEHPEGVPETPAEPGANTGTDDSLVRSEASTD